MVIDQWLMTALAKVFFARYGHTLRPELHKWEAQAENDRLIHLMKRLGGRGRDLTLRQGVHIIAPERVHLGDHIGIGYNTILRGNGGIRIEDYTIIGDQVILATDGHPLGEVYFNNPTSNPIHIGQNVWVAGGVIVVGGVTVGENSVIAAGAVVTEDVPPNSVVAGVPARVIKTLIPDPQLIEAQKAQIRANRAHNVTSPMF
jgi:maltose O-acetyltransferase